MRMKHKSRLKTISIVWLYYLGTIIMKIILLIALMVWTIPMLIHRKSFIKGMKIFETFIKRVP